MNGKRSIRSNGRKILPGVVLGWWMTLLFLGSAWAQTEGEYRVRWVAEYPGESGAKAAGLGDRLSRIVFGKKPREVIKPFNIVAAGPDQYWILDQGAGGVFEVLKGEGELIRPMKRMKGEFPSLVGMCLTPAGDMLFTDSSLDRIMQVADGNISEFADTLSFQQPTGIACNRLSGEVWVVETGAHRISVLSSHGKRIRTLGGRGTGPGRFNYPTFIWMDARGRVYVVDSMNFRVQIFDAKGQVLTVFGTSGDATGNMARPKGIATDSMGHIYVADALFHAVQIFDDQGNFLYSFGSQGQGEGEFWMPAGIFIDQTDHIYVADSYNARVQVFQLVKNGGR